LFGVCDGHGPEGHFVSRFLADVFPKCLKRILKKEEFDIPELIVTKVKEAVKITVRQIKHERKIDAFNSGSTLTAIILTPNCLYSVNIGDSRTIKITNRSYFQLTTDHKPSVFEEKQRIFSKGGRVIQLRAGKRLGQSRVYLKGISAPGLAISRSFGDFGVTGIGVISVPEVKVW